MWACNMHVCAQKSQVLVGYYGCFSCSLTVCPEQRIFSDGSSMFHSCFVLAKATCGITALAAPAPPRRSTSLLDVEDVAGVEGVARRATLVTLATLPSAAAKPSSATPLTPLTPLPLAQELPPNGARERRVGASLGAGAGQDAKVKATAIGSGGARVTLQLSQASHKTYLIALQLLSVWDLCSFHGSYYVLEVCVFWHCSERG